MPTTYTDRYGLPVTAASPEAAAHYLAGVDCALAMQMGAQAHFEAALAADPACALAHMALAREHQYRGQSAAAQASKARALHALDGVTRREQQHVTAMATAVDGDGPTALRLVREHLQDFPRDAWLLKQADGPFGLIGFSGMQERLEANFALLDSVAAAYGDDWWFLSAYAFAQNELGHHETARRLVQRALELYPQSGHSAHTMAHVYFETGEHAEGADFLASWMPAFPRQAQIYSHLTWHWALCALACGDVEQADALYAQTLAPGVCPGAPLIALCDASALLWRYDLYGVQRPAGSREAVAAFAAQTLPRAGIAFGDVHCALAYAAAGETEALGQLAEQLQARLAQGKLAPGPVVPAIVMALTAFAQDDYAAAVQHLEPVADQVVRVGGSNAQREVVEDTLLQAYLRSGHQAQAMTLLQTRLARRPSGRDTQWLAQAAA